MEGPDLEAVRKGARAVASKVVEVRRAIHRHPELGNDLPRTRATVLEALAGLDLEIHQSNSTSGIVAVLNSERNDGGHVLLRGDMDALPMPEDTGLPFASEVPGRMHACGHDTHTAMLVGAAHLLCARRDTLPGKVTFMFQPGEEGPGGAQPMLDEGILEAGGRPDGAFALHVHPTAESGTIHCKSGTILASADTVKIHVVGRGGHGSMPFEANDPVPVACEMVQAFQTLVTRRFDPFDPVVITVGVIRAGTVSNVIPEYAYLELTVRSFNPVNRDKVLAGIARVASGIASAHDMTAKVETSEGYPPTVNTTDGAALMARTARELVGDVGYVAVDQPIPGAEDFSLVINRYGGAFAFLGAAPAGADPTCAAPCHSNHMLIDEEAMVTGVAMHVCTALNFLEDMST
jgi:amidohydrolase